MGKKIEIFIVIALSLFAVMPFFINGFFPMHDDTQVVRVSQMAQALSDGHFPVRWVKDLGYGYGYPVFNFYAPLAYYIGGFFNLVGFDALLSTKIMMVVGILLAGVFMYLFAREIWGRLGGIVSALFYMYAPYHAVDIYVRGAVGEFWAYAFLPLMAYGFYRKKVFVGAVGFAGVILSHNLTAMMVLPFLLIVLLLQLVASKNVSSIKYQVLSILLGLGISAFYWLPALLEQSFTNVQSQIGGGADFRDHFVCWQQLWDSHWGFGGSTAGCGLDGLSFRIGKIHLIISIISFIIAIIRWKKDRFQSAVSLVSFCLLLVAVLLTLEVSRPVWEIVTPLAYLQYPWRFLLFIAFFSSFLAGGFVWYVGRFPKLSLITAIILLTTLLYMNQKLFEPHYIEAKSTSDYVNQENITWITSKTSDEYMPKDFAKPLDPVDTVKKRVQVGVIKVDKTQELSFETNGKEAKPVLVSIAPFPAWQTFIDGSAIFYTARNNGIEVTVPSGPHTVKISYVSTSAEKISNVISIIGIVMFINAMRAFSKK